jgi:hypothetical protein
MMGHRRNGFGQCKYLLFLVNANPFMVIVVAVLLYL